MNAKRLLVSVAAGALALMIGVSPAMAQEKKPETPKAQPKPEAPKDVAKKDEAKKDKSKKDEKADLKVGAAAPEVELKDTTGKEWNLADLTKSGKIVVLQWLDPECPYVQKHYDGETKTFNELNAK